MITKRRRLTITMAVALGALGLAATARAQFGDGVCTPGSPEVTNRQCAILGQNILEVVPPSGGEFPVIGTCQVPGGPVACAFWPYRFSGPTGDNQLNILIPAALTVYSNQTYQPTNSSFTGCQQLYTAGQGDPTTGFGKGIITYKTCRVAFNFDVGPGTPNLVLATAISSPGAVPVQQKTGKGVFFDDILAPFSAGVARLSTTKEEITSIGGAVLTIETNQAGALVSATSSTGPVTIIPPGFAVLCTPVNPTNVFPNNFPGQYDCAPIVENLDGKNIQAGEHSTCYYRRQDGTLAKYFCPIP